MKVDAAIAGIGASEFGRFLPDSQLRLAAKALKAALDAGCFYVGALGSRKTHGKRV